MYEELKAYSSTVDRLKEIKLLPCPNCGEARNIGQNSDREWHIYCFSCGMRGPAGEDEFRAADAWNALPRRSDIKRVERERDWLAKHIAELKCPEIARFVSCDFAPRGSTPKCIECWLKEAEEATLCQK